MAFKRTSTTAAPENIVWAADYAAQLSVGLRKKFDFSKHDVTGIVYPKSGKGYVLNIDGKFACFVWRNSPDGKAIGEFLNQEIQMLPCILINLGLKSAFEFGFDDERGGLAELITENKWRVIPDSDVTNEEAKEKTGKSRISPPIVP